MPKRHAVPRRIVARDANDISTKSLQAHVSTPWHLTLGLLHRGVLRSERNCEAIQYLRAYVEEMFEAYDVLGYIPGDNNCAKHRYEVAEPFGRPLTVGYDCPKTRCFYSAFLYDAANLFSAIEDDAHEERCVQYASRLKGALNWSNPGWFSATSKRGKGVEYQFKVTDDYWNNVWLASKPLYEAMATGSYDDTIKITPWETTHPAGADILMFWHGLEVGDMPLMLARLKAWGVKVCTATDAGYPLGAIGTGGFGYYSAYVWAARLYMLAYLCAANGDGASARTFDEYASLNLQCAEGNNPQSRCEAVGFGKRWPIQIQNRGNWWTEDDNAQFPSQDGIVPYGIPAPTGWKAIVKNTPLDADAPLLQQFAPGPGTAFDPAAAQTAEMTEYVFGGLACFEYVKTLKAGRLGAPVRPSGANDRYYLG